MIRSLNAAGHHVVAVDAARRAPGLYSRATWRRAIVPDAKRQPDAFAQSVGSLALRYDVDLVLPITDESIMPLAARDRRLPLLAVPHSDILEAARDKARTIELASSVGVPTPESALVATSEAARVAARALGWPVVLKPRRSRVTSPDGRTVSLEVQYANDEAEVERRAAPVLALSEILVQRYHPGAGVGVELLTHEGRPMAAFQHRRIREVPFTGGASAYREAVPVDSTLLDHAVSLLGALRWTGLAMVEFKVDGRNDARLLEVNGRIWGSLPLATKSGMDFPARYVDLLLNGPPRDSVIADQYRVGTRSRHLGLDLVWIASVLAGERRYPYLPAPARSEALGALARLLLPSSEHDILSVRDPVPGLIDAVNCLEHIVRKAAEHRA